MVSEVVTVHLNFLIRIRVDLQPPASPYLAIRTVKQSEAHQPSVQQAYALWEPVFDKASLVPLGTNVFNKASFGPLGAQVFEKTSLGPLGAQVFNKRSLVPLVA